jgi:hypothetical protein
LKEVTPGVPFPLAALPIRLVNYLSQAGDTPIPEKLNALKEVTPGADFLFACKKRVASGSTRRALLSKPCGYSRGPHRALTPQTLRGLAWSYGLNGLVQSLSRVAAS